MQKGYSKAAWASAKEEARSCMIEIARNGDTVTYTDLAASITSLFFQARDPNLNELLRQVACDEDAAGRGMLTVIVVHKHGDKQPGPGFYELAQELGKPYKDKETFWIEELKRVYRYWSEN